MLDMLQQCLKVVGITMLRIDGSVTSVHDRQQIINRFNSDASMHCLLLTTGVGGVGITLTGADRVVIYDPSWNPATDAQVLHIDARAPFISVESELCRRGSVP